MPSIGLYQFALQHPERCFNDEELRTATVVKANGSWIPATWSGNFAVVFKLETKNGPRAVRCFSYPRTEHEDRYKLLQQHLQTHPLGYLTHFEYQPEGIQLEGGKFPIVKMEWVEGKTLDKRVEALVQQREVQALEDLSRLWRDVVLNLQQANIAHGDMQHGNILSQNGSLRLVDYDGVFIPSFQGKSQLEIGHKNYQHPGRNEISRFDLNIDHFSSFVIYLSIKALAFNPKLWDAFHQDDYLILKKDDYIAPHKSQALETLRRNTNGQIRELANKLAEICTLRVEEIPSFDTLVDMPVVETAQPIPPTTQVSGGAWWEGLKEVHPMDRPALDTAGTGSSSMIDTRPIATSLPNSQTPALAESEKKKPKKLGRIVLLVLFLLAVFACLAISANIFRSY